MAVLNPNNWHWVDKNTLPWTKEYFDENIKGLEIPSGASECMYRIVEVSKVAGDSNVSQRKGKPICYFDLSVEFKLDVIPNADDAERSSGSISLPEFMHDDPDFEIRTSGLSNELAGQVAREFLPDFRKLLLEYQVDLLKTHSQDLQDSK